MAYRAAKPQFPVHRTGRARVAALVVPLLVAALALLPALGAVAIGEQSIYIPMVSGAGSAPPNQNPSGEGGFFLTFGGAWTQRADVAIDSAGGHHVVFAGYEGFSPVAPVKPVYYAYCAATADCAVSGNWEVVGLTLAADAGTNEWSDIELSVAGGRVAFLAYADTWFSPASRTLIYAECTSNCTAGAGSWRGLALLHDPENDNFVGRSFALDPSGYPHVVYHADDTNLDGVLHYASCSAADCSLGANWSDLAIKPDTDFNDFGTEYIAFTADGKPRLATTYQGSYGTVDEDPSFTYWECDSGCATSAANWSHVSLYPQDSPFGFALSPSGKARGLIFGSGWANYSPDIVPDTYNYVWCDADCLSAASWHASTIGSPTGEGDNIYAQQEARLAVDRTGRPYVVYHAADAYNEANNGVAMYYCASGCQADGDNAANWHRQLVETTTTLEAAEPIAPEYPYVATLWEAVGQFPRIAFDAAGNPRLVYGNIHWQIGRDTNNNPTHTEDLVMARLRLINRP